jgi:hypothetical protein
VARSASPQVGVGRGEDDRLGSDQS